MIKFNEDYKNLAERGASLIIALVFVTALFLIITSALKFQRSTAENISQSSMASSEKWMAKSLTSRAVAWLNYKLPAEYKKDLQAAVLTCENKNLPAFNPSGNNSARCEFSYLGNINDWLKSKKALAISFAVESNQSSIVEINLSEVYRTTSVPASRYTIHYFVESRSNENYGTDKNQGEIILGELENCNCELRLTSSSNFVSAGDSIILTAEFWNVGRIELYENGVVVDSSLVQNSKIRQTKIWTRVINSNTEFFVRGSVASINCSSLSNKSIVSVTASIPTPTPTPNATPISTPTPTPPTNNSVTLNGNILYRSCSGEFLDYTTSRTFSITNARFSVNFNTGPQTVSSFSITITTDLERVEVYQNGGFSTFRVISSLRGNITNTVVNYNSVDVLGNTVTEYLSINYPVFTQPCEYYEERVR
jgi:hypothetical protein